ncbi:hypothetical protein JCGZ_00737 [Jatropha curcas]|uniref:Receptor-like serine/threonine-protein kinase n=1 Tax=Jatropha curcas TaxID=180498 RepID=A0A067L3A3_JATCU|nr:hypothetical protein JCGZ_00737 [Jatropha curcas]
MERLCKFLTFCFYLLLITAISTVADTLNITRSIRDDDGLVSAGGSFRLGFFSPLGTSKNKYLGIWYNNLPGQTVVWVANREIPITDSSGVLRISDQGMLVLTVGNGSIIWSSNSTRASRNPIAQLLDSGNLVVKNEGDDNPENYLWQSFDYPTDTFLPGMKLGWNREKGLGRYLTPWKTSDNPARGNFSCGVDAAGYPQLVVRKNSKLVFRAGSWNGLRFSGAPGLKPNSIYTFGFVLNEKELYYHYELRNSSLLSRSMINNVNGLFQRFLWNEQTREWRLYSTVQMDNCDQYALCGSYGSCNINNSPTCSCLEGFEPKVPKEWDTVDWSSGCVRKIPLNCAGDGFRRYSAVKLPDTQKSWYNKSMNLEECRTMCLKNCSCIAYTNLDIRGGGSGCLIWYDDLLDTRHLDENGQDIYIRMAASEIAFDENMKTKSKSNKTRIILSTVLPAGMLLLGLTMLVCLWKKKQQKHRIKTGIVDRNAYDNTKEEELELPLFDFNTIASATDNFSINNKLGEGGFGPVFKGTLKDGQEIAVKRLSKNSNQGLNEFKNEVMHIAKLQHRNLVKLLGCCIESEEKMLVYEFMPNTSLDCFLFDEKQSKLLDWPARYQIINGIARGLLYLHQDSRLRIIHRDLKAGNMLLDYEMNPKISDFGLARSFGGNETEANTNKVVGTYGYMSPEYAIEGIYSVKSDVFSFGVIVLEIVSGKRNRGFSHEDHDLNLLGHAWQLHKEGRSIELIDTSLRNSYNLSEVLRSVHVGLLCVQGSIEDRPSMSAVVYMLGSEGALPEPKLPGFFTERDLIELEANSTTRKHTASSTNGLTITVLDAR